MSIGRDLAAFLAVALLVIAGWFAWQWQGKRADKAEAGQELAIDNGEGRKLEVEGTENLAAAAGQLQAAAANLQRKTNALEIETRADPETATRIPEGELARLRAHDRILCDEAPRLDGCAPAAP